MACVVLEASDRLLVTPSRVSACLWRWREGWLSRDERALLLCGCVMYLCGGAGSHAHFAKQDGSSSSVECAQAV